MIFKSNDESIFDELNLDSEDILYYSATRFRDYMEQFVPKSDGYTVRGMYYPPGSLRKETIVSVDGDTGLVEYEVPYATYQYYGERADGTHKVRNYTTPGTGKYWDELMMTAVGDKFKEEIEDYIGSKIR